VRRLTGSASTDCFSACRAATTARPVTNVARAARVVARGHSLKLPDGVTVEKQGRDVFNTTYYPKGEDADFSRKPWVVIDASGLRLGRLATVAATYLRGGNSPSYTPAFNMGVNVIVLNADKVVVTGQKAEQKIYYNQGVRGKPGSMKYESYQSLHGRMPERVIERAIRGMLPKNRMGRETFTHLKVYAGSEHPHAAQSPTDVTADVVSRSHKAGMVVEQA
jgi:large subunit ribosomal protein L13